jgi:NADP-dependent 3-hydroxy acid dehydrogenase YdfG
MSKTILITGATSGIGKATALYFAQQGFDILITGRRKELLEELETKIKQEFNVKIKSYCFDIRNRAEVEEAIEAMKNDFASIDILLNNAGGAKGLEPIQDGSIEHWETMIDTNIKGILYMTRLIAPMMLSKGEGHIINICSTAGHEVYPNGGVYCATKHAVDALTKGMRYDMYKYGIRVSQVSPGMVEETEFALNRFDGDTEKAKIYEDVTPLKSKDIAEIIYFIATRPRYVNIQDVLVMGTQQASGSLVDRSGRKYEFD